MSNHILFIIDGLPGGGAENITLTLAKGLADRELTVTVLSLSTRLDYEIPVGVNYVVVPDKGQRGPLRKMCELGRRAASLDRQLPALFAQYGRPTLVISSLHKTDRIVVRSRMLAGCNLWFCVHGMFSRSYLGNKRGFSRWLKKRKIQRIYRNRKVMVVSDAVGDDLTQNVGVRPTALHTIYNPFDIDGIRQRATEKNPFAGETYMVHIGRFHPVKRHDRLLDAFAQANLPCKLVLLGKGEPAITQSIKDKIVALGLEDRVILAGFAKNPLPVINGARLAVLSSDSEGLPSVLIEALICNTPVVSTACPGGVTEIMKGELRPFLANLDAASLAEKMHQAWQHFPEITPEMYQKFSYARILDAYLSLQE